MSNDDNNTAKWVTNTGSVLFVGINLREIVYLTSILCLMWLFGVCLVAIVVLIVTFRML